jgi:formylglycine-generating enzyme required for sulfatase activity
VRFVLLLDGLNEFDQAYAATGRTAVRRHVRENAHHIVHLTCRTADFDPAVQSDPVTAVVPDASIWIVQPLADAIRHWDAQEGHSDVRDYLRQHLGAQAGRRLYERIHADDRLREAALIPLLLWMIKEVGGDGGGDLPADRGGLLRSFVETALHRHEVPVAEQDAVMRSLAAFGWRLQAARRLVGDALELDAALREGCCVAGDDPVTTRRYLQRSGLLLRAGADRHRLLHQLLQEYAAAADFVRQPDCANRLSVLARDDWQRELCILALWLHPALQTPAYLLGVLGDPAIDLRVRVAAGEILARVGDPRLKETPPQDLPKRSAPPRVIEPAMVTIPAGVAVLGGEDPEGYDHELPAHPVPVAAFALAVHPVTNAEYACFMAAGGYDDATLWTPAGQTWLEGKGSLDAETEAVYRNFYRALAQDAEVFIARLRQAGQAIDDAMADGFRQVAAEMSEDEFVQMYTEAIWNEQRREPVWWDDSRFNGLNQPVVGVNWYEAMAYAAWLARVTGKAYRLPTEAEWEWAARRGTRRYAWPGAWDASRCNWSGSRLNRPAPIGLFPHGATPDGLHDLAGNVYEWTASLYRPYPYVAADGREAADAGGLRVMRGGSWYTGQSQVRGGYRYGSDPGDRVQRPGVSPRQDSLLRLLSAVGCWLSPVAPPKAAIKFFWERNYGCCPLHYKAPIHKD